MVVNLAELRERGEPLLVNGDFSEKQLNIQSQIASLSRPAHARMKVSLSGERVRVTGSVDAELNTTCSRCATQSLQKIEKKFDLEYWPDPAVVKEGDDIALTYDELDIGFYREDQLDLSAVVSEQIVLEIPMKPICREDCKGLCDVCGADLNVSSCSCEHETVDPRLAGLAELKRRLQ